MDASTVLQLLSQIAQTRPFDPAVVGAAAGLTLVEATSESNPYFTIHRSTGGGPTFSSIEVRAPTSQSPGKGGLVIASVREPCVKLEDVGDRFGAPEPGPPSIPRPGMPKDSPRYTTYPQPWGQVRLGFSPSTGCLVSAVLDAT